MSNTHTLKPDPDSVSTASGVEEHTPVWSETSEYIFSTESRALTVFLEDDVRGVPVSDLMETQNKHRIQGPSAFKTHEQFKRELFGG